MLHGIKSPPIWNPKRDGGWLSSIKTPGPSGINGNSQNHDKDESQAHSDVWSKSPPISPPIRPPKDGGVSSRNICSPTKEEVYAYVKEEKEKLRAKKEQQEEAMAKRSSKEEKLLGIIMKGKDGKETDVRRRGENSHGDDRVAQNKSKGFKNSEEDSGQVVEEADLEAPETPNLRTLSGLQQVSNSTSPS